MREKELVASLRRWSCAACHLQLFILQLTEAAPCSITPSEWIKLLPDIFQTHLLSPNDDCFLFWLRITFHKLVLDVVFRMTCTGMTGPEWGSSKLQKLVPRAMSWLLADSPESWTSRSSIRGRTEVRDKDRKLMVILLVTRGVFSFRHKVKTNTPHRL